MRFRFRVYHIPGVKNKATDALSRFSAWNSSQFEVNQILGVLKGWLCLAQSMVEDLDDWWMRMLLS